jgi:hypothetical protein
VVRAAAEISGLQDQVVRIFKRWIDKSIREIVKVALTYGMKTSM